MGEFRSGLNGMVREIDASGNIRKVRERVPGYDTRWEADGRLGPIRFEDKFGPRARLSDGQELAQQVLRDNFILYHFTPEDVGRIVAQTGTIVATPVADFLYDANRGPLRWSGPWTPPRRPLGAVERGPLR